MWPTRAELTLAYFRAPHSTHHGLPLRPPLRVIALTHFHTPCSRGPLSLCTSLCLECSFCKFRYAFHGPATWTCLLHSSSSTLYSPPLQHSHFPVILFQATDFFFTRKLLEDRSLIYSLLYSLGLETMPDAPTFVELTNGS